MSDVNRTDIHFSRDEKKTAAFQVRMRPSVKAAGEQAAAAANRSLASLMETLLIDHLRSNGYLKAGRGEGSRTNNGLRPDQLTTESDG